MNKNHQQRMAFLGSFPVGPLTLQLQLDGYKFQIFPVDVPITSIPNPIHQSLVVEV